MGSAKFVLDLDSGFDSDALAGTRAAGLARLSSLDLRTQSGFVVLPTWMPESVTDACRIPPDLAEEISEAICRMEAKSGRQLTSGDRALLLTVRYGDDAPAGADRAVHGIGIEPGAPGAGGDGSAGRELALARARFLEGYARLVMGDTAPVFGSGLAAMAPDGLSDYADELLALLDEVGQAPPVDGRDQLNEVLLAVARRAASDGRMSAVTVQAEIGRPGSPSVSGVVFSRNPLTGAPGATVSPGPDVPLADATPLGQFDADGREARDELIESIQLAEAAWADMCELEFAVGGSGLWFSDARIGRRTSRAEIRIATDLVDDGMIDIETALGRISLGAMKQIQRPVISRESNHVPVATCLAGSPGAAFGTVAVEPERVLELAGGKRRAIYVCDRFEPVDRELLRAAAGIVIKDPGGSSGLEFEECPSLVGLVEPSAAAGLRPGMEVSLDGDRRILTEGPSQLVPPQPDARLARLLSWCDELEGLPVLAEPPPSATVIRWEGDRESFRRSVEAAEPGAELHLELAAGAATIRGAVPAGSWAGVIADPTESWMAALLAAKLTLRQRG